VLLKQLLKSDTIPRQLFSARSRGSLECRREHGEKAANSDSIGWLARNRATPLEKVGFSTSRRPISPAQITPPAIVTRRNYGNRAAFVGELIDTLFAAFITSTEAVLGASRLCTDAIKGRGRDGPDFDAQLAVLAAESEKMVVVVLANDTLMIASPKRKLLQELKLVRPVFSR